MPKKKNSLFRSRIKDPTILAMLDQPVGSPLPLTREQAIEIVNAGIGSRPDLPPGDEFVKQVSWIWRGLLPRD
jgi:hypothetical protein